MMDIKKLLSSKLEELVNKKMDEDYTKTIPAQTKEMDMHYQTFMKYYNGISDCPSRNLLKIAKYYGVSVDYLLGIEDGTTHDTTELIDSLGLSEQSIKLLKNENNSEIREIINFLIDQHLTAKTIAQNDCIDTDHLKAWCIDWYHSSLLEHLCNFEKSYIKQGKYKDTYYALLPNGTIAYGYIEADDIMNPTIKTSPNATSKFNYRSVLCDEISNEINTIEMILRSSIGENKGEFFKHILKCMEDANNDPTSET